MKTSLPVHLPQANCIQCGPSLVYVDAVDGADWARCLRCDQVCCPWDELREVVAAADVEQLGMAVVVSGCGCGTGGCSGCGAG